ncbi:hypothetical protein JXL83_01610 [candidate division WOR-3 bacterium]|nr:hypothetical protein [candidate division WOR-3 bacterium]
MKTVSFKMSLKVVFFSVFLLGAFSTISLFAGGILNRWYLTAYLLLFVFLCAYLAVRLFLYGKKITVFLNSIYKGEYKAGIRKNSSVRDELTDIADLSNKASERLCKYDKLRAEAVRLNFTVLEIIFNWISEPCMLLDSEQSVFYLNKSMQALFGVSQNRFSFASIENRDMNTKFTRSLLLLTLRDKVEKEFTALLQLPVREETRKLMFHFIPVRGKDENVKYALLFAYRADEDIHEETTEIIKP